MSTTDATGVEQGETTERASGVSSKSPQGILGRTIDQRYQVEALLGEGGMGLVYRARHTRLNKVLAIKVLRRENTGDEEVLARFQREAESASAIGNQHIVDISDFGTLEDGSTYFVMECLEGMDLIEAMDIAQRIPEARTLQIAVQICDALGAAHDAGIVHRDLKPENIYLIRRGDTDDFVKVLDFGIAKVAHGPTRLTRQGEVLGTPHYMSPEQCEGEDIDHRTDVYALGVLLYEMLTGNVPHDADTLMGILTKHLYEEPIPPKIRVPQVSEELQNVIMRCLEKQPEKRYQTMRELEADLKRVLEGRRPIGPETVSLMPTKRPSRARGRLTPVFLGGLGVALIALVGTLALTMLGEPPDDEVPTTTVTQAAPAVEPLPAEPPKPLVAVETVEEPEPAVQATQPERTTARATPVKRKPKSRQRAVRKHDPAILDPWK